MRKLFAVVAVGGVAVSAAFITDGNAASRAAAKNCGVETARTVLLTPELRIVERVFGAESDNERTTTYGCLRYPPRNTVQDERKRRVVIKTITECDDPSSGGCEFLDLVTSGNSVAYHAGSSCVRGVPSCGSTVGVVDIQTRRRSKTGIVSGGVAGLDVTPTRTAVWIESPETDLGNGYEVRALTISGERLLLERSPEIGPQSLALSGQRLYWVRGDQPQTALVP